MNNNDHRTVVRMVMIMIVGGDENGVGGMNNDNGTVMVRMVIIITLAAMI